MKHIITAALATVFLAACGGDETSVPSQSSKAEPSGKTVAALTKNGQNAVTTQASDAWFVLRVNSFEQVDMGNYCKINAEIENRNDNPLYMAVIDFTPTFSETAIDSAKRNPGKATVTIAPKDWTKPNTDPIRSGEIRKVSGRLEWQCDFYQSLALKYFNGFGTNDTGVRNGSAVQFGAPALIIENNSDMVISR